MTVVRWEAIGVFDGSGILVVFASASTWSGGKRLGVSGSSFVLASGVKTSGTARGFFFCTLTVLLVLEPFALVFLAVLEDVGAVALALTLVVLAFVHVTVLIHCAAFAVRLAGLYLAIVVAPVLGSQCTNRNLLSANGHQEHEGHYCDDISFGCH